MRARTLADYPILTWILIGLLAVIYTFEVPFSAGLEIYQVSAASLRELGGVDSAAIRNGEYFRLFIAPLLHANLLHLLTNMISLSFVGALIEHWLTRCALFTLYILGGIAGAGASYYFNTPDAISVGASGAILGLGVTALIVCPSHRDQTRMRLQILGWLLPSLIPLLPLGLTHVDNSAHIGGAVFGLAAGVFIVAVRRIPRVPGALIFGFRAATVILLLGACVAAPKTYALWQSTMKSVQQLNIARDAKNRKDYNRAVQLYTDLMNRNPRELVYAVELGQTLAAIGRHSQALALLKNAAHEDRRIAPLVFNEGVTLFNHRNFNGAAHYFRAAAYADPGLTLAWENLCIALTMQGDRVRAARELELARKLKNSDVSLVQKCGGAQAPGVPLTNDVLSIPGSGGSELTDTF